jgi:LmbE family N-acetylglucosaminyl deacetylase
MRVAVISPHLDDAVFSVAEHMLSRPDWEFTIVTPFGGQPLDEPHRSKYLILHDEHQRVCEYAGWDFTNGPFLDDAAAGSEPWHEELLSDWLHGVTKDFDSLWWPVGIRHPDHRAVRYALHSSVVLDAVVDRLWLYEELPYRVLYPFCPDSDFGTIIGYDPSNLHKKRELCRMYASQVDDQLERCLYAPERLWGPR